MVGLLFHVLYLLGKCIYDRYHVRKTRFLPDIANEEELFKYECDALDDDLELENTSWWTHRTIGHFYPSAHDQRQDAVLNLLKEYKEKLWKIVDYGCGELKLVRYLKDISEVEQILCVDVDREVLERNKCKAAPLITEMLSCRERSLTIEICEGSVTDNDLKLKNANAVICMELIEHLYPDTLIDFPFNIFGYIKPEIAIITTPNAEYNVVFPRLSGYRHPDHKFEWTREQFQDWAQNIVVRYPYYRVEFHGICYGPEGTEEFGPLTQMAVFHRILPRKDSRLEILIPDEYIQLKGQQFLFSTVATYKYYTSTTRDIRSDEQKLLDEVTYYINNLSYGINEERIYEIYLDRILDLMHPYPISIETLRSILTDAGWIIVDRENGPAVLNPSEEDSSDIHSDFMNLDDWDNEHDWGDEDSTNIENIWDYATGSPIDETAVDENERHLSEQNSHIENWHEELSITNEENRWDYATNPSINETSADTNEEYPSEQNLQNIQNLHELACSPNFTDEDIGWNYESGINETPAYIHEEYLSTQNLDTKNWFEKRNFIDVMNRLDSEYDDSYINQSDVNEYSSAQNPHIENWHEEPSIIIPENCSINQENTYLFDGGNDLVEESQSLKEPYATNNDIKQSGVRNIKSLVYTERELPSNSIALTLNEVEAQLTASNMSAAALNNSLTLKTSDDDVTVESVESLLQDDQINLRTMEGVASMSNFQSHMSVSRSSTSLRTLYFSSEMNNSLQDFSTCYQNESSINNQCLLNNTFHQSEMATEAAMNTGDSTAKDISCFKESLPKKNTQDEINFLLHTPDKNPVYEDNDMTNVMSLDAYSFNNKPKYTSSPHTKMPTTHIVSKSLKYRELIPAMNSSVLLDTPEEIKEIVSDIIDSILLKSSQESNSSITETIKPYATSSSSNFTNTSRHDIDSSASNSTQQNLCLENKEFSDVDNSISTELIQGTNKEFTENSINHESNIMNDIQNADASHVSSLGNESINHKDKNVYCTLAKTDLTKAHLENVISDLTQLSIKKKDLNPPRELLNSKSQSISKCSSSDCAKEISVLRNDKFVPCKSSEDTSNVFTSTLKNEENVSTSKDVSNATGVNNVEVKSFSPLETPPNSWSPEIMDSGYPNSVSAQDITPEYELPSIAQDYIPDSESPSIAEAPRLGVLEPIEVENGDLANNNRDDEGNNMMAVDANDIENLQPLIDVLENDLENENDIYVMQNGFPIWLLRILDMPNPLDFDMQARQNLRIPDGAAGDINYVGQDEGFDSSSSESESDVAYNEMENDNGHGK